MLLSRLKYQASKGSGRSSSRSSQLSSLLKPHIVVSALQSHSQGSAWSSSCRKLLQPCVNLLETVINLLYTLQQPSCKPQGPDYRPQGPGRVIVQSYARAEKMGHVPNPEPLSHIKTTLHCTDHLCCAGAGEAPPPSLGWGGSNAPRSYI